MAAINLCEQTYALLQDPLLGEGDMDTKILRLLKSEFLRQLADYQALDQALTQKYAMPFTDFTERRMTVQHSNSWEVENDATEWAMATRRVAALEGKLQEIHHVTSSTSHHRPSDQ